MTRLLIIMAVILAGTVEAQTQLVPGDTVRYQLTNYRWWSEPGTILRLDSARLDVRYIDSRAPAVHQWREITRLQIASGHEDAIATGFLGAIVTGLSSAIIAGTIGYISYDLLTDFPDTRDDRAIRYGLWGMAAGSAIGFFYGMSKGGTQWSDVPLYVIR